MTITMLHGDCTELLPTLPPASAQCIVTSPPYFGLRDYGLPPTLWPAIEFVPMAGLPSITIPAMSCCLGLESDPLAYIGHLVHVFRLARPALRDDGTAWLNLGDSYAQDSKWGGHSGGKNYTSDAGGISRERKRTGLKDKDLMMIPARAALALQADGWWLRNQAIWWKPNAMPESVSDRLTNDYEPVYLLAKSARYFFDAAAIAEPAVATENRGGGRKIQNLVTGPGQKNDGFKDRWRPSTTRNRRTVWRIPTQPLPDEHYAPWPEALAELCIRAGSGAQACEHCGAAWARVVEQGMPSADSERPQARRAAELWVEKGMTDAHLAALRAVGFADAGKAQKTMTGYGKNTPEVMQLAAEAKAALGGYLRELLSGAPVTTGFQPACTCAGNTGSAASVVLDMFAGSGTTLRVAERLQRNSIGIDLNGDYLKIQERRTNGVQVELFV